VHWPGNDASLLGVIAAVALVSLGYTAVLGRGSGTAAEPAGAARLPGETVS
jgi:hypothetical protein